MNDDAGKKAKEAITNLIRIRLRDGHSMSSVQSELWYEVTNSLNREVERLLETIVPVAEPGRA